MPDNKECVDCRKTFNRHKKDPSKPYLCHRHHCPYEIARGQECSEHKKAKDDYCLRHTATPLPSQPPPPICSDERCQRLKAGPASFCKIHSCLIKGCLKGARPGEGKGYCDSHKCEETRCQLPRRPFQRGEQIFFADFCQSHECSKDGCPLKIYPNKCYCVGHACRIEDCRDERGGHLDMCLKHHNDYTFQSVREQERSKWEREQDELARAARAKREKEGQLRQEIAREEREKIENRLQKEKEEQEEQERKDREKRERDRKRTSNTSARSSDGNFGCSDSDEAYSSATPKASGSHYHNKKPPGTGETYLRPDDGRDRVPRGAQDRNSWYQEEPTHQYASSGTGRNKQGRYYHPEVVDDYDESSTSRPRSEFRGPLPTRERPVPVGRDAYGRPIVVQDPYQVQEEQDMYGRPPADPRRTRY